MKARKKQKVFVDALIVAILLGIGYVSTTLLNRPDKKSSADLRDILAKTCKNYMQECTHEDMWWLPESMEPTVKLDYELSNALTNIQHAIAASKTASPLARQISETFTNFVITEYQNGSAIAINKGNPDPKSVPNTMEVCFISEKDFRKGQMPSTLWYWSKWDAVMLGALAWPRPFFDAVLMHETGHAFWKKTKGQPPEFSHDWFVDEVTMHELETAVLDNATEGKYSQKMREICKNHPDARNSQEFVASVTVPELLELDKIVGVRDCGHDVRGGACMQHITALGFVFTDSRKGTLDDKIAHY